MDKKKPSSYVTDGGLHRAGRGMEDLVDSGSTNHGFGSNVSTNSRAVGGGGGGGGYGGYGAEAGSSKAAIGKQHFDPYRTKAEVFGARGSGGLGAVLRGGGMNESMASSVFNARAGGMDASIGSGDSGAIFEGSNVAGRNRHNSGQNVEGRGGGGGGGYRGNETVFKSHNLTPTSNAASSLPFGMPARQMHVTVE